jgi:hypothetical protein
MTDQRDAYIPAIGAIVPLQSSAPYWMNQGEGWYLVQPEPVLGYGRCWLNPDKASVAVRTFREPAFKTGLFLWMFFNSC